RHPIAQGLSHDLRDSATGFKENSRNALFTQSPSDFPAAGENPRWKLWVVNDLRNPNFPHQLEVAIREAPFLPRRNHTTDLWHSWPRVAFFKSFFNLSAHGGQATNERIVMAIEALCSHDSIVKLEC